MSCYLPLGTMLWVLFVLQFMIYMACGCILPERIALMHIRSSLVEANAEVPASWGRSDDCCSWERVRCNNSTRVFDLDLNRMLYPVNYDACWSLNLATFSSFHELQRMDLSLNSACLQNFESLQGLTKLRYQNLSYNNFIGNNTLESLGKLASLEVINFEEINLSGALQNIAFRNLKNLQELRLGFNQLTGTIPASLFELPHLEHLDLSYNHLQGHIPIDLSRNLKNLLELHLESNLLNGSIPASLLELPRLEYLDLSYNLLQGHIPKMDLTRSLNNLRELHLRSNLLSGSIPKFLFELPLLKYLDLSRNLLQGLIPISSSSNLSLSLQTLNLAANNLNGKFDFVWLRNCAMLNMVDLSGNADLAIDVTFRGSMPLFQLRTLLLSGCNLDDSIIAGPNFLGTQRHLQSLDLSNNNLTGIIPNWILANQATVRYLNLSNNSLVGSLDLMLQHQSNLHVIDISMNHFTGQLPTNISSMFPNLEILDTSYNNIYGYLQPSLCNIETLAFLDLSNNDLTGELPPCLFTNCSELYVLKLSNNKLVGPILGGVSNLPVTMQIIYLDSNNFEGALPNNLSSNSMQIMDLHDNRLSGELDMSFWNLPSLMVLSVARNSLTGEIYPSICKFTGLQYLDVSANDFEGSLPNCSSKLTLNFLNMSSNTLSGCLSSFCNSSYAIVLDLRYNQFNGTVDWIQHLSQIKMLFVGGNKFEGQISLNLCHLQYLNIIDLSHNRLSGSLPPCIGGISFGYHVDDQDYLFSVYNGYSIFSAADYAGRFSGYNNRYEGFTFSTKGNLYTYDRSFFNLMSGIDLSGNMLEGEIPWEMGNLSHVKSINLSHNHFTGPIPATLANMSAIESLDLSHNELSGPIPRQLTQLWSLEVFSVAYNNLSGCIPNSGQFSSFGLDSYVGNTNLHNLSQGNRCSPPSGSVEEKKCG